MKNFNSISARLLSATLLGAVLTTTACTRKNKLDYGLNVNETLRWDIITEPPTLDWDLIDDTTSGRIADAMMDGLVRYGFDNNQVQTLPALAVSWTPSKDMKEWTFTLRQDVKWTDGVPFTGQQVIDGWERLLNPKTASEYASYLFNVKNAKAFFDGKIKDFKKVGVKLNDKGQLVVDLEHPQSFFPSILGNEATFPIRKDLIEKYGDKWTSPEHIATLGEYKLKIWDHDKAVVLERNDGYYGQKPKLKYILGMVIPEDSTALDMFKKDELDVMDEIPSIEYQSVSKMKEYRRVPILGVYYFAFNIKMAPVDNVKVRQALEMAIDKSEINKVLGGAENIATGIVPPGLVGYDSTIGLKFDPVAAGKLLDEAGYKDRSKFPSLTISFNTDENHQRIAENIQAQLKKNLGIDVQLANEEWKTYLKSMQMKVYPMFRFAWIADFPDADTFINLFESDGSNNNTNWSSKTYDDLVAKGASEADATKRQKIYSDAQKLLVEKDAVVLPIYFYRNQFLINSRVKNYPLNVLLKFYPENIELSAK